MKVVSETTNEFPYGNAQQEDLMADSVAPIDRRYQVFISSTFSDLDERKAAVEAVFECGIAEFEHYMLLTGSKAGVLYFAGHAGFKYEMTTPMFPATMASLTSSSPRKRPNS